MSCELTSAQVTVPATRPKVPPKCPRSTYNGQVHGDPASASSTAVLLPDYRHGYAVGKDLLSPTRANTICGETMGWVAVLPACCEQVFPAVANDAEQPGPEG